MAAGSWKQGTNAFEAFAVILGQDQDFSEVAPEDLDDAIASAAFDAPRLAAAGASFSMVDTRWASPSRPMTPVEGTGAPPLLVVGTLHDPATPYVQAQDLVDRLDNGSWLLTVDAYGPVFHEPCSSEVATAYLLAPTSEPSTLSCVIH